MAPIKLFAHPQAVIGLAGHEFTSAQMQRALAVSPAVWDSWTRGDSAVSVLAARGRGRAGRSFTIVDAWILAIYGALVRLTDSAAPIRFALARFVDSQIFDESDAAGQTYEAWRATHPDAPVSEFRRSLRRSAREQRDRREKITKLVSANPFEAPPLFWARDEQRPWFLILEASALEEDRVAVRNGDAPEATTLYEWCAIPDVYGTLELPPSGMFLDVSYLLARIDARLAEVVAKK